MPPAPLYLRTLWRYTNAVIIIIIIYCVSVLMSDGVMTGDVRRHPGRESVGRSVWASSRVPRGVLAGDAPGNADRRPTGRRSRPAVAVISHGHDRFSTGSQHLRHDRGHRSWLAAGDDDDGDDDNDSRRSSITGVAVAEVTSRLDQLYRARPRPRPRPWPRPRASSCRFAAAVAVRRRCRRTWLALLWSCQVRTSGRRRWVRRRWAAVRLPTGPPRLPPAPLRAREPPRTAVVVARRLRLRHRRRRRHAGVGLPVAAGPAAGPVPRHAARPAGRRRTVQQRRRRRSAAAQSRAAAPRVESCQLAPLSAHGRRQHRHLADCIATHLRISPALRRSIRGAAVCPVQPGQLTVTWGRRMSRTYALLHGWNWQSPGQTYLTVTLGRRRGTSTNQQGFNLPRLLLTIHALFWRTFLFSGRLSVSQSVSQSVSLSVSHYIQQASNWPQTIVLTFICRRRPAFWFSCLLSYTRRAPFPLRRVTSRHVRCSSLQFDVWALILLVPWCRSSHVHRAFQLAIVEFCFLGVRGSRIHVWF